MREEQRAELRRRAATVPDPFLRRLAETMDDNECAALLDWLTANYRGFRAARDAGRFPSFDDDAFLRRSVTGSPDIADRNAYFAHWRAVENEIRDLVAQGLIFNGEGATLEAPLLMAFTKMSDEEGVLATLTLAAYFAEQKKPAPFGAAMTLLAAELSFFRKRFALSRLYLERVVEIYGDRTEPWARQMAGAAARAAGVFETGDLLAFFNAMDVLKERGQPFLDIVKTLPAFQQPMHGFLKPLTAATPAAQPPAPTGPARPSAPSPPRAEPRRARRSSVSVSWPVLFLVGAVLIAALLLIATRMGVREEVGTTETLTTETAIVTDPVVTETTTTAETPEPVTVTIGDPAAIGAPTDEQTVTLARQLFPAAGSLFIVPPASRVFTGSRSTYRTPVLLNVDGDLRYLELVGESGSWTVRRFASPPPFTEDDAMRFLARGYGGAGGDGPHRFLGLRNGGRPGEYLIDADLGAESPYALCVTWATDQWLDCEAVDENPEIP